jgi:hypothetical protein
MNKWLPIIISVCILLSCTSGNKQAPAAKDAEAKDTAAVLFFPVTDFLKGQMAELDSLQLTPLLITTIRGKTDSTWLKKEAMRTLLEPFLLHEINAVNVVPLFKATKFNDQTLNAVTFTYDPIKALPDSIAIRHWDIYINPETGKVTKLYIVKKVKKNGIDFIQQLTWQTGKWSKIIIFQEKPGGNMEIVQEDKVIWDLN